MHKKTIILAAAILTVTVVTSMTAAQVNAQGNGAQHEAESQKAMQIAHCKDLKSRMASDESAAAQYKSKDCEGLLK